MTVEKQGFEKQLIRLIKKCPLCPWIDIKTQTVPPIGSVTAEVFIVGRNPGKDEDKEGIPFVGRAGQKLNEFLEIFNLRRENCWISNCSKCYGGEGDSPPTREVYETCFPWLVAEICLVRPKLIITLGSDALRIVTGYDDPSVLKFEGQLLRFGNTDTQVFVMTHPSYWLRNPLHYTEVIIKVIVPKLDNILKELGIICPF